MEPKMEPIKYYEIQTSFFQTGVFLTYQFNKTKSCDSAFGIKFSPETSIFASTGLRISSFPLGLKSIFPNLNIVTIVNQNIKSLSQKDLEGLENLTSLTITGCQLESLPDNLFENMKNLKQISFQNNKLQSISSKLLKPILGNGLTLVDLRGNTNIDAIFTNGWPTHVPTGVSLKKLMEIIDAQCTKPLDEDCIDQTFIADLSEKFIQLWISKCGADFKIITKDSKEILVHKNVLMVSSSVFSTMFQQEMQENNKGFMRLEAYEPEAVQQFFGFLYTGQIPNEEHAIELFAMAAVYEIPELKTMCKNIMLQNIKQSNALDIFSFAHLYSLVDVKQKAFASIQEMFPDQQLKGLFDNPSVMKELVEANQTRKRKLEQVEEEYSMVVKKLNLEA